MQFPGEEVIEVATYRENSVGKNFKASKTEYVFEFFINGKLNTLKLIKSAMSGKLRIFLNENLIHFDQKFFPENYKFEYNIGDIKMTVTQKNGKFDLSVVRRPHYIDRLQSPSVNHSSIGPTYIPPYANNKPSGTASPLMSPPQHPEHPFNPYTQQPNTPQMSPTPIRPLTSPQPSPYTNGPSNPHWGHENGGRPGTFSNGQSPLMGSRTFKRTDSDKYLNENQIFFLKTDF